jgi:hypothetical protein
MPESQKAHSTQEDQDTRMLKWVHATYAAAVAQEDADRRQEDGEEHFHERRRRHGSAC